MMGFQQVGFDLKPH